MRLILLLVTLTANLVVANTDHIIQEATRNYLSDLGYMPTIEGRNQCPSIAYRAKDVRQLAVNPQFIRSSGGKNASKQVVIVGAGPAGLYAALAAFRNGHKVVLVEKQQGEPHRDQTLYINDGALLLLQDIFPGTDLTHVWPAVEYPFDMLERDYKKQRKISRYLMTICEL